MNRTIDETSFSDLKSEILRLLKQIKKTSIFQDDDGEILFHQFATSISSYLAPKQTKKDLAKEIYMQQYNQHGSVKTIIYAILYSSSADTISKFSLGFPLEVEAFKKYGKTNVHILKEIMNGK